jgi:CDP-diacylglycerol--serine O-phosphatidyltransferase
MVSNIPYFSFKETELLRRQPFWSLLVAILLLKLLIAEPQIFLFFGFYGYALSGPGRVAWVLWRRMHGRPRPQHAAISQPKAGESGE